MKINRNNLKSELTSVGASEHETKELMQVAKNLSRLKGREPVASGRHARGNWWFGQLGLWSMLATSATGLVTGGLVVLLAQTSYPGNALYPIKLVSERVTATIQPDFRTTIMMRRAQEVKVLVANRQPDGLVVATLRDYKTDMSGAPGGNYAALDYCHSNLVQAQSMATVQEKQQIAVVLSAIGQDKD